MAPVTRSRAAQDTPAGNNDAVELAPSATAQASDLASKETAKGIRVRQAASTQLRPVSTEPSNSPVSQEHSTTDEPPRFIIDLSLPPEQRYLELCAAFKDEMLNLTALFDEVVGEMVPFISSKYLHLLCRTLLRGVKNEEENRELKGISKATGVAMYLLVCFNVLLDLFMGCSSGGAAVGADNGDESKMLHFRTLDWGMPALRRVVVQLDYVLETNGPIYASSITYAGYVGVLTGVRKGLSMSLNFRPNRVDNGVFWSDVKYGWHHAMVLLGWRQSISSVLRGYLLPWGEKRLQKHDDDDDDTTACQSSYEEVVNSIAGDQPTTTTACYFCFSDDAETTVFEKDRISAKSKSDTDFIVVTNTDESPSISNTKQNRSHELTELLEEAAERQACAITNWRKMHAAKRKQLRYGHSHQTNRGTLMGISDVVQLVQRYPTTNECTHFACVLDPSEGRVVWCKRWLEPINDR